MNANINTEKTFRFDPKRHNKMRGVSLVEIIIVLVIISILSAISIPYIFNYTKLYKPEDQALKVMDLMREASQMALTRRRTMRFEIDLTANEVLIIDENGTGAADDRQIKAMSLEAVNLVRMDAIPTGVTAPAPPNYGPAAFAADTTGHLRGATNVNGNNVWAARFRRDGTVVNTAGSATSNTLYLWEPLTPGNAAPKDVKGVRAITIFGGTGAVRYWKHNGTTFLPTN
jgi:prepilin-type N-terminal cleavage/methylation domain-containing protein